MMAHEDVTASLVRPNEATLVTGLSSCANLDGGGGLYQGRQIHGYIVKSGIELTVFLGTALISMYGKTGCLENAFQFFDGMMVKEVCTWNAMISSLACNGREQEALMMFEKMRTEGFRPNEITFVAVLSACARAKLLELGLNWFQAMSCDFGVVPRMEHYGCVVDLLGRAGLLEEAEEFIRRMPFEPDATVLGALLGGCKIHGAIELAEDVGRMLLKLQPQHCGRYVVLSNIFAQAGKWADAAELRKAMVEGGIRKVPAHSWLESV
ncbi:Pentatricopeptide repeat [Macleaya cordata]|uniref:Pentatricopeptide repeat n=1 Tax=Macleaya cordata TaxID=56857 RepID=A0A200QH82_MACCD|nr:Pentatricopeptide repeat [Macleaya cordata]